MAKRKMSAAARKRISAAAKLRWAQYRKAKASGQPVKKMGRRRKGRGSRRMNVRAVARTAPTGNPYLTMTVEELVSSKRQIDQAMKRVQTLLSEGVA